jgi:hypothetical protein
LPGACVIVKMPSEFFNTVSELRHPDSTRKTGDRLPGFKAGRQERRKAGKELMPRTYRNASSWFPYFLPS